MNDAGRDAITLDLLYLSRQDVRAWAAAQLEALEQAPHEADDFGDADRAPIGFHTLTKP